MPLRVISALFSLEVGYLVSWCISASAVLAVGSSFAKSRLYPGCEVSRLLGHALGNALGFSKLRARRRRRTSDAPLPGPLRFQAPKVPAATKCTRNASTGAEPPRCRYQEAEGISMINPHNLVTYSRRREIVPTATSEGYFYPPSAYTCRSSF